MQLATGPDDEWVVILDVETDQCRIRAVSSGDTRWVARSEVTPAEVASLHEIGEAIGESRRRSAVPVQTARAWGLVVLIGVTDQVAVRELVAATSECESDLNGLLADLEAGGVLERTDIAGERAYALTERGLRSLEAVWPSSE